MRRTSRLLFITLAVTAQSVRAQSAPPAPPAPPTPVTPASSTAPAAPAAPATPSAPATPAITAADVDRDAVIKLGRLISAWANDGSIDSLIAHADAAMGTPAAVRERLTGGLASFSQQLGTETKLIAERVMLVNGQVQYWRDAEYVAVPIALVFRVVMGKDGTWRGFTVTPPDQLPQGEEVKQPD